MERPHIVYILCRRDQMILTRALFYLLYVWLIYIYLCISFPVIGKIIFENNLQLILNPLSEF